ncbi:hypothetical protein SDC9_96357 [bioreactor metagenome]|uniref:Uncharacterized protein n=1 Tax=bioreactor metagenome TaxID=1076179 RepID=A0A645A991_9ZZZZ
MKVAFQCVPRHLKRAAKQRVLAAELLHSPLCLLIILSGCIVHQAAQGHALQSQRAQHGLPLLVVGPHGQRQRLLPLHALVQPVQIVRADKLRLLLLHAGNLLQRVAQSL